MAKKHTLPDEDVWRDRRATYGRHLPARPTRQSRVPAALSEVPEFQALAEERAALIQAENRLRADHEAMLQRNEEAKARHREAIDKATFHGAEWPEPLVLEEWRGPAHPRPMFDEKHCILEGTELGILDARAEEWREHIRRMSASARQRERDAAQALRDAQAEVAPYDAALRALKPQESVNAASDAEERTVPWDRDEQQAKERIEALYDESRIGPPSLHSNFLKGRR